MFNQLLASDKAPFILSLALSVLGWLLTAAIGNLADVVILGVESSQTGSNLVYTLTNHSVRKSLVDGAIGFACPRHDCLAPIEPDIYARARNLPPYAIQGNRMCLTTARNFNVTVSLPPKAQIAYEIKLTGSELPRMGFNGLLGDSEERCPGTASSLKVDNIWIIEGASLVLFLVDYHDHLLFLAIIITVVFLIWAVLRPEKKREEWS